MIPALALLGYAAGAAWLVPALLTPLTRRGLSVRGGLAAWLAAMASVLAAAALALQFSLRTGAADWPQLTQALCRSVAGGACTPAVYRSVLYQAGIAALGLLLTLAATLAAARYARRVRRSRVQTRSHARTALLVGTALRGTVRGGARRQAAGARTVVLDDPRPAAYCAAGRPAAIVVTSGALAVLDEAQLDAVLAHERAHLAGRHHALTTAVRGLTAAFPAVPLFARGAAEIARLVEMSADAAAARSAGRRTVAAALLALATGRAVPGMPVPPAGPLPAGPLPSGHLPSAGLPSSRLAAAAQAVPARVDRLLAPSRPGAAALAAAVLAAVAALLVAAPPVLAALLG